MSANDGAPLRFGLIALGLGVVVLACSVRAERRRMQARPAAHPSRDQHTENLTAGQQTQARQDQPGATGEQGGAAR